MSNIVGIDLGTTNSLIAYMDGDTPRTIPGESGQVALPSIVAFTRDEGIFVGIEGKERLVSDPAHTIYSIKRYMGKGREDLGDNLDLVPYSLVGEEKEAIRIQIGQKRYTPPEISAHILRALKNRAESALNISVDQVVITVPAYFNDSQRQATKDAGEIAGLNVLRILNEPTAASLAYGLQKIKKGTIAVYDLGGGTFDISILKINHGIFEVLATNGNTYLGGDDFDRCLVTRVREEILKECKIDIQKIPEILQEVRLISEKAKCELSSQSTADFSLVFPEKNINLHGQITREEFEASIRGLVDLTISSCRSALSDAKLEPKDIDEVVLVGGSTRIPLVKNAVRTLFNQTPKCELNPDEVVAMGAAVQANILSGGITDMLLLDVTPLSLGIETMGGIVNRLIPRNTTIPTTAKESYTTYVDGQKSVSIHVVQGERELVKDCRSLAKFNLTGIDPMLAGMPRIEVTFLIDANGILNVTAKDLLSGRATSVDVTPTYGLSEEETAAMITASMEHAKEDLENRQLIESRTEAGTVLRHSEKALIQEKGLLDQAERQKIENAISELKVVLSGDDRQLIREKLAKLDQATQTLAERLMSQSVKEALKKKKLSEF